MIGSGWRGIAALALFLGASPVLARAQGGVGTTRQGAQGRDTILTDSGRVSVVKAPAAKWAPLDSAGLALMKRPGMTAVRYQGESVEFDARGGVIKLVGAPGVRAIVEQEPTSLVADTIEFAQKSDSIRASGDTIVMHDPGKGEDVVALGRLTYDLVNRRGSAANVSTAMRTSETWLVEAHRAAFSVGDSAAARSNVFYGMGGSITSCTDSLPHYDFAAREVKRVGNDLLVARNVVMYVQGVPVLWMPFMFQDTRKGRRSGILTPRFGITELVRNSPNYRRTVENVGYYFAISDYVDFAASLDWRSSAAATDQDPGWTRWNSEFRYRWLDRFASGRVGVSLQNLSSGASNTQVSWSHTQDLSLRSHLSTNLNFATSTAVQRQTALAPLAALATIASQANFQRDFGTAQLSIGGSRRQYPGRPQVDMDFPTFNLTSRPLDIGGWLTWTPGLSIATSRSSHIDSQGDFTQRIVVRSDGTLDSAKVDRGTHSSSLTLTTPFKVFDFQITAALRASDRGNDYPELRTFADPVDTSKRVTRVYERTYLTQVDYDLGMNLPQFFGGTWNLVPSISMANVASGAVFVRSERTGTRWVSAGKRFTYGLGVSPTFYALYGGVGSVAAFRHSIQTSLSYTYSPAKDVSAEYLAALGQTQAGFLGSLAQNRVTLSIQQVIEAKLRAPPDSGRAAPDGGRKVKLLSLQFSPITWDFERARHSKSGFATDHMDVSLRSDLLPGFDAGVSYSLFQGNIMSDTAVFSPYLESVRASFSLGAGSGIAGMLGRVFGGPATGQPTDTASAPGGQRALATPPAGMAGQSIRGSTLDLPSGRGLEAQVSFSLSQQRAPVGGNVVQYDPTAQCAPYQSVNPLQYSICVQNALATPPADVNAAQTTAGGTFFRVPPQMNVQGRTSFNLTPKWSASWSTNYDFQRSQFGMQSVTLQRDMHDWRAIFGFTQAPNGNFSFTFFISLKAEPDLKFDYNRSSYGSQSGTPYR
ncbi:MAG: LPS-assembly protein LptD [Gemmatimonadaceae bacterium]|nr:LPS-assembly protein LptD [Gemmatimonadaceae bacterium]